MDHPAQDIVPENLGRWTSALDAPSSRGRHEMKAPVRPLFCVVADVSLEDPLEVPTTVDQHVVEALSAYRPYEPLGEGVRPRCPDRRSDDPHALRSEHLVERSRELGVPIA